MAKWLKLYVTIIYIFRLTSPVPPHYLVKHNNSKSTRCIITTAVIYVVKAQGKDEEELVKQSGCVTPTRFQRHSRTVNLSHIPTKLNCHINSSKPPHSPSKPSLDYSLSYCHYHVDPSQYQRVEPRQSAATMLPRLQSLHQLVFHVVDLAKRVPGFQLITQHDQLHVIKRQSSMSLSLLLLLLLLLPSSSSSSAVSIIASHIV